MSTSGRYAENRATTGAGDAGLGNLRVVLDSWRSSLLDMGGRNRLLNFRHTRSGTLELTTPDAHALLSELGQGWAFAPVGDDASVASNGKRPGLVTQKRTQAALDASLHRLRRKAGQMFNDYGLWVLWLGVGMLDWREGGSEETAAAPLLLVPVELRRSRDGRHRLHAAEGQERVLNPALTVKLGHLGIACDALAEADPANAEQVFAAARAELAAQPGWSVEERVVLGLFASHKEAMYQDLLQNEKRILGHPLIRAVALGAEAGPPGDSIDFEPPDPERIDEVQAPERTPLVLDADASQRQCIAAALAGRSFVMNGPPGTGKSQTITNMIAALMHAGRRVLFVSEKAAALDVVRNRLRSVGLDDFVLALHSGDTTKKAVATELARVLTSEIRIGGAAEHELDRARQLREELSAYAVAMNEVRQPLGRTVHDVLGRLVLLEQDGTAQLALPAAHRLAARGLSASGLQEMLDAAGAIGRAWRPAAQGPAFVWHGLIGSGETSVLAEAEDALTTVRAVAERRPFAGTMPEPRTSPELRATAERLRPGSRTGTEQGPAGIGGDAAAPLARLAEVLGAREPATPEEAFALLELADLAGADHRPPRQWFDAETLRAAKGMADGLRKALASEKEAAAAAEDTFDERVRTTAELPELVQRFTQQHREIFARWFSDQFKVDRETVTALTRDRVWHRKLIGRLGDALAWHEAAQEVERLADQAQSVLGRYTPRDTDGLAVLDQALAAAERIAALSGAVERRDLLSASLADGAASDPLPGLHAESARSALAEWCDAAVRCAERWTASATALIQLFGEGRRAQLVAELLGPFDQAVLSVAELRDDPAGPSEWRAYRSGRDVLAAHQVDQLVDSAVARKLTGETLPTAVEYAVLKSWADDVLDEDPRLQRARSADLDARVAQFRQADERLVETASGAVIEACNGRRPRNVRGGAAGLIIKQSEMKRRHMPVRDLLGRTRDVVKTVKPCFMMSPLTVSKLLPSDFSFDVVIFDEASQVRPADAVNCIYRAGSLVVAGDEKQLPPTSFFDSAVEDDGDEYDEDLPDTFQSLLDACKAAAMRVLPLRWHYRSRHESLIAFSNHEFYDNAMITFPGAVGEGNDTGVAFFHVADGRYDRGGRRDNLREAEYVAQRVVHHFDTRRNRSLGVVALSQAQASAIDLAVQQARINRPDLDEHFTEDRLDGFFVKNLESVQGDERDVMILSVGYGPDEHARLRHHFGPINKDGGWKRLNVAVTRARYRTEVVASFLGSELGDSTNESVRTLKRYLEYARNGLATLARDTVQDSDAEPESPFEESVYKVLRAWGYAVQPQVGVAGYRIDLGLRHPAGLGGFALGIECDGAMYHSSRAARDRDRLREQVLTGLGWKLYRIWGTDWYRARASAETRLRDAVEAAMAEASAAQDVDDRADTTVNAFDRSPSTAVVHQRVPVAEEPERPWVVDYTMLPVALSPAGELHTPEARPQLGRLLMRVIEAEGPIHEELLVQRAREAWGLSRAGARIRGNVHHVLQVHIRAGRSIREGDFYDVAGRNLSVARRPSGDIVRRVGHVAPGERQLALLALAAESPGISGEELMAHACELFGWRRMGPDIRAALLADIATLYALGKVEGPPDSISVA
ncbi:DUF3320 domain-containing protein [Streptomyces sp. MP131-18]|uniref:DUF3320 domain-containing protein n=1 Tax=Streptomyces sp. MP131-18 TaxID=1857892 RepID=UPI00097BDFE9|nr:DUF3320 domain-containing protein [Streptomyces sp. MP131-18]ONK15216.1 putative DNA helicase [Streptomyces sp. MP131-18]